MGTSLDHVMIVGGDEGDWEAMTPARWDDLIDELGRGVAEAGGRWLTMRPYGAPSGGPGTRWTREVGHDLVAIVDSTADGRVAFASAVARIPGGGEVDEKRVAEALYEPAVGEPDLIVILGPADHLPPSLVWELAYGELVYSARPFESLDRALLDEALRAFARRDRRFGGLSPS
ncbi:undecaprenyl diphosphate synthase family protein [Desertimonas flava]|uniref:undecaprenyl diphosphate synthase family protein n=1 Tax=Desertimonas flava TaxID=2064846 RepID=UPI0013C4B973|nr:undecaprenyl diphosphate synthase family protein [Desertimonas flava]